MATEGATFDAMRLFQKYHFPLCKADVTCHDIARRLLTHLQRSTSTQQFPCLPFRLPLPRQLRRPRELHWQHRDFSLRRRGPFPVAGNRERYRDKPWSLEIRGEVFVTIHQGVSFFV